VGERAKWCIILLSGYNALPCNPGHAALPHVRVGEQEPGRGGE
jgi:hypothetical protein